MLGRLSYSRPGGRCASRFIIRPKGCSCRIYCINFVARPAAVDGDPKLVGISDRRILTAAAPR